MIINISIRLFMIIIDSNYYIINKIINKINIIIMLTYYTLSFYREHTWDELAGWFEREDIAFHTKEAARLAAIKYYKNEIIGYYYHNPLTYKKLWEMDRYMDYPYGKENKIVPYKIAAPYYNLVTKINIVEHVIIFAD